MRKLPVWLLGIVYIGVGLLHFIMPKPFKAIMPPYVPYHLELVYLSGVAEILGGVGVLVPRFRKVSGVWLILTMIAVFPANIHMALNTENYPDIPRWTLYARLPLQFVIILTIYWIAIRDANNEEK